MNIIKLQTLIFILFKQPFKFHKIFELQVLQPSTIKYLSQDKLLSSLALKNQ